MSVLTPMPEIADVIVEYGGEDITLCFQCGTCTGVCPWTMVRDFNIRKLLREGMLGLEGEQPEDIWLCVTCGNCAANCPRGVSIIDLVRSMRAIMAETGSMPKSIRGMLGGQRDKGNPFLSEPEDRNKWALDAKTEVPAYDKEADWMLYTCCAASFDPANHGILSSLAEILNSAGVSYGLAPADVVCCGDSVREAGDSALYQSLAAKNIERFDSLEATRVLTTSPHCHNAFANDYPEFGSSSESSHYTQLFADLLRDEKLKMTKTSARTVTYHDPCYLGRHNGIYDEPRQVISAIPGVKFVEMKRIRENSVCCGGGGGGMFMEIDKDQRFADLRVAEALETGADTLATACPYCKVMFRDSIARMNAQDRIEVLDIAELVKEVL